MTLTELKYIRAVAKHRHFGRAAQACHVSQPTLSVAVKKLEDELGITLFERGAQDLTVTPLGAQIVAQAERVLAEAEQIKALAAGGRDQLSGPLAVGFIYTIGPYLLPLVVPAAKRQFPNMPLLIREDFTDTLVEALRDGDLDVAVVALPAEAPGIVTQPLYQEPFVAALPADHPLAADAQVSPEALTGDTMLLLAQRNCFRDQVLEACPACRDRGPARDSLQRTLEGGSLETIRHMVAAGAGVTLLPKLASTGANAASELVVYRPFTDPVPGRTVGLAYRRSFPRPEAIHALAETVRASVADDVEVLV